MNTFLLGSYDVPKLKLLHDMLKDLNLPRIPSLLLNTTAIDPIISAAKFRRVLGYHIFFYITHKKDYLNNGSFSNNTKIIIEFDNMLAEKV